MKISQRIKIRQPGPIQRLILTSSLPLSSLSYISGSIRKFPLGNSCYLPPVPSDLSITNYRLNKNEGKFYHLVTNIHWKWDMPKTERKYTYLFKSYYMEQKHCQYSLKNDSRDDILNKYRTTKRQNKKQDKWREFKNKKCADKSQWTFQLWD